MRLTHTVALFMLVAAGCAPTADEEVVEAPLVEVCGRIDSTGGVIRHPSGAKLTVPEGAMGVDRELCMRDTFWSADELDAVSPVFAFSPAGLTFAEPLEVQLPYTGDGENAAVFWSSDGGPYEYRDTTMLRDVAVVFTEHFSTAVVAEVDTVVDSHPIEPEDTDLLFVIDNSCSMAEEQSRLAVTAQPMLDALAAVDFHLGVVTTDMEDWSHKGKLVSDPWTGVRFIDADVPDSPAAFSRMIRVGTWGAADERGRDAVYTALETRADMDNAGFYRPDARLGIVVVSDEDDYSETIELTDFAEWLRGLKPDPTRVSFHSVVGLDPPCESSWEVGSEYLVLLDVFGGLERSVCALPDYEQIFAEVGWASTGERIEFALGEQPIYSTLEVYTIERNGTRINFEKDADYAYLPESNSVRFHDYRPQFGSIVYVEYLPVAGL